MSRCRGNEICLLSDGFAAEVFCGSASPPDVRRWLCPAVKVLVNLWGWVPGLVASKAQPQEGKAHFTAGQSHRLTSGGEAEPFDSSFEARPSQTNNNPST